MSTIDDDDERETGSAEPVADPRQPGEEARERVAEGDENAVERYVDSPGAGLAGALDELPEPNEPG
ncbi:MAG: hypothetical protein R2761_18920 [Acidimicrobiales bacterium]